MGISLFFSCHVVALSNEPAALAQSPVVEKIIYKSPDGDEPVISDASIMCRFNHRGYDRAVYKSSQYMKKGEISASAGELRSFTFYVNPLVMVERNDLREAIAKKVPVLPTSSELYEISFRVLLLDDELKMAAAKAINEQFNGANITAGNISIIPYKFIEVTGASSSGDRIQLGSYPDRSVSRAYGVADRPNALVMNVRGTASFLQNLGSIDGRLGANFLVSGFSIKQNVVSASLYNLVQTGYSRFLNGEADWSLLHSTSNNSGGLSMGIGPIQIGLSNTTGSNSVRNPCWVTRNQLRTVVEKSFGQMNLGKWTEIKTDTELRQSVIELIEKEVQRRSKYMEARIAEVEKEWRIQDATIQADIAPTILAKLNDSIKAKFDLKNKEMVKGGTGSVGAAGEHEREINFVNDTDIIWNTEGTLNVPKSIKLYNVNSTAFNDFASMSFTETIATKDIINEVFQGVVLHWKEPRQVKRLVPVDVPKKIEVWYNDRDKKSYVVQFPDLTNKELMPSKNDTYKSWCIPFDPKRYKSISANPIVAAADETIHVDPTRYGLPAIHERWPHIMDDERWYIYDYLEETLVERQVEELVDMYE